MNWPIKFRFDSVPAKLSLAAMLSQYVRNTKSLDCLSFELWNKMEDGGRLQVGTFNLMLPTLKQHLDSIKQPGYELDVGKMCLAKGLPPMYMEYSSNAIEGTMWQKTPTLRVKVEHCLCKEGSQDFAEVTGHDVDAV